MSPERPARWVRPLAGRLLLGSLAVLAVAAAGGQIGGIARAQSRSARLGVPPEEAKGPPEESARFGLPDRHSPEAAWWADSMKTRDARIRWWREARFGMFVHWSVYSRLGNTFEGRKGGGYAEHIQRVLRIPIPVYRDRVAAAFNPTEFDADAWIRAARDAGMGYFVITAKHHDGFAMWDSRVNDYTIARATPFHRDPMKELQGACRKYRLKFGFYYSHAFDWGDADAPGNDWDYDNPGGDKLLHGGRTWWESSPELVAKARQYVDRRAIPQLLELIATYDPDIFWFDTPSKLPPSDNLRIMKAVRAASSRVVINGRLVYGWGDYDSTTDRPAEFPPHPGDWEGIPTTNESYGWNPLDDSHKPPSHFIRLLAKAAARGGNLLMNIGPMGTGRMDPKDLAILAGIGDWWRTNHESIHGTAGTPLAVQSWGESTGHGGTLYLHLFSWPSDRRLVVGGLRSDVRREWLLADPEQAPLKVQRPKPLDVGIEIPAAPPDQVDSVVVLECAGTRGPSAEGNGDIATDSTRLLQPVFPVEELRAFDGELHGGGLRFGPGKARDAHVEGWLSQDASVTWNVRLNRPASYEVAIVYDAESPSSGNRFAVSLGDRALDGSVQAGQARRVALGRVALGSGTFRIRVMAAPGGITQGELFRLRCLELRPVEGR